MDKVNAVRLWKYISTKMSNLMSRKIQLELEFMIRYIVYREGIFILTRYLQRTLGDISDSLVYIL